LSALLATADHQGPATSKPIMAREAGSGTLSTEPRGKAKPGAVTLIQRFGSALNLNIHFRMLFLDGVYVGGTNGSAIRFRWAKAPSSAELTQLAHTMAQRVGRFLEQQGLVERDAEASF
jgi:hypothetical protein